MSQRVQVSLIYNNNNNNNTFLKLDQPPAGKNFNIFMTVVKFHL